MFLSIVIRLVLAILVGGILFAIMYGTSSDKLIVMKYVEY